MAIGRSVHVGVNEASEAFEVKPLSGCVGDATRLSLIAEKAGFQAKTFFNKGAIFKEVEEEILKAAHELNDGDIFLFTFAGHGSFNASDEEEDFQDEMILFHDCLVSDNYLRRKLWSKFKEGVRILGIADCCHSGTVLTSDAPVADADVAGVGGGGGVEMAISAGAAVNARLRTRTRTRNRTREVSEKDRVWNRGITFRDKTRIVESDRKIHQELSDALTSEDDGELKAALLTLAACQDSELATDGPENGVFTARLLEVWNEGAFDKDYDSFITEILTTFGPDSPQHPVMQKTGNTDEFVKQIPFTINPGH